MKKLILPFALAGLMLGILFGCQLPPQRIAVNTLATTHNAVDTAVAGYFALTIEGTIPTNNVPVVARDYRTFQRVYNIAVDLVAGNTNAVASADVLSAATAVINDTKH